MSTFLNPISAMQGLNGSQPPPAMPDQSEPPKTTQLRFEEAETHALRRYITQCESQAREGNVNLSLRRADQLRQWREKVGQEGGNEGKSNFRVPLILALCLAKHAREVEALFGRKAAINAVSRGPADIKFPERVGLFMTWQVYENMNALKPIALWTLKRLQHGRAYAFVPWETKRYNRTSLDPKTRKRQTERVTYKEGPQLYPMNNDDIILPVSVEGKANFDSVQNAEWVIRRYFETPARMLMMDSVPDGEQNPEGDWYQGVKENWRKIVSYARQGVMRDSERDASAIESDLAEGVQRDGNGYMQAGQIEVWEWYGKWRRWVGAEPVQEDYEQEDFADSTASNMDVPPDDAAQADVQVEGTQDAARNSTEAPAQEGAEYLSTGGEAEDLAYAGSDIGDTYSDGTFIDTDGQRKEMLETDIVVRYCPRLNLIVGIQDLAEIYPDTPTKRPIMELALINDGQYNCMGLIELSEEIEKEMTNLVNRCIQAAEMSIGPPVFADPSMGEAAFSRKYEPFDVIWTTNPGAVKQLDIKPNLEILPMLYNLFQSIYEQVTGITNMTMGRGMDQPNAPRTLGGQRLIMGASDVRLALDMRMLSEDLKIFLNWVWDMSRMFGSEEQFYRVAEGDSRGQFDAGEKQGNFAKLGAKEREGNYDFTLEMADDMQVREGKKQEKLAMLPLVLSAPVVQMDMRAQHALLKDAYDAFGVDYNQMQPEPPPQPIPLMPDYEWTLMLQGDTVHINPMDDDRMHLDDHNNRIEAMMNSKPDDRDEDAMLKMWQHIKEHEQQMMMKMQAQALAAAFAPMMGAAQNGIAGAAQDPMAQLMSRMPMLQGGQGAGNGTAMGGTSNAPAGQGIAAQGQPPQMG